MSGTLRRIVSEEDPQLTHEEVYTRDQIREDASDEEGDLWGQYLLAARDKVESECRRALLAQTWRLTLDCYPCHEITLERCPVQSITSFEVKNSEGEWELVDPENYELDSESEPGRLVRSVGGTWPQPGVKLGGIRIEFVAGYESVVDIPPRVLQALRLLVGHWYRNRTPVALGTITSEIEFTYKNLVLGLRW